MVDGKNITFAVADVETEERVVREYLVDAFERFDRYEGVHWPSFNRYGQDPTVDRGEVVLRLFGEVESALAEERPRWDEFVDAGLVREWTVTDAPSAGALDDPQRLALRLQSVASRMSLECFRAFETLPDAVDEFGGEEAAVGWGVALHHLFNQLGYQGDGGEEELDLLFRSLLGRLHGLHLAPGYGQPFTDAKVEELTTELDAFAARLEELDAAPSRQS